MGYVSFREGRCSIRLPRRNTVKTLVVLFVNTHLFSTHADADRSQGNTKLLLSSSVSSPSDLYHSLLSASVLAEDARFYWSVFIVTSDTFVFFCICKRYSE